MTRPAYGTVDGHGRYGILDRDPTGRLVCHECGATWEHLGTHARGAHDLAPREYRAAHGLPETTPLVGATTQERMRAAWEARRAEHLATLAAARDPAAANAASRQRDGVPWAPGTVAGRQARGRARRRDLTPEQAAALGDATDLPGWCQRVRRLIADTGLSVGAVARAVDMPPASVHQRLRRHPPRA